MALTRTIILFLVTFQICYTGFIPTLSAYNREKFELFCSRASEYFENKDVKGLNSLIHSDFGIFTLYRMGVPPIILHETILDKEYPVPYYYPYSKAENHFPIKYTELPEYNCDTFEWEKQGIFADTLRQSKKLSEIIEFNITYDIFTIPDNIKRKAEFVERNSWRLIFTDIGEGLVIYVTFIDDNWYLTVIDRITTECGA